MARTQHGVPFLILSLMSKTVHARDKIKVVPRRKFSNVHAKNNLLFYIYEKYTNDFFKVTNEGINYILINR